MAAATAGQADPPEKPVWPNRRSHTGSTVQTFRQTWHAKPADQGQPRQGQRFRLTERSGRPIDRPDHRQAGTPSRRIKVSRELANHGPRSKPTGAKAAARSPVWQARSAKPAEVNADEPTSESQAGSATKTRSATGTADKPAKQGSSRWLKESVVGLKESIQVSIAA